MPTVLLITGFILFIVVVLLRIGPLGHLFTDARFLNVDLASLLMKKASYKDICEEFKRKAGEKRELLTFKFRNILSELRNSSGFTKLDAESQKQIEKAIADINTTLANADLPDCLAIRIEIGTAEGTPEEIAHWEAFKNKLSEWGKETEILFSIHKRLSRS